MNIKPKRQASNPYRRKASSLRSNWLARVKKFGLKNKATIPTLNSLALWLERQEPFTCAYTGIPTGPHYEVDHMVPVSRGGSFNLRNIAIASKETNSLKGNMTSYEFDELLEMLSRWDEVGRQSFIKRLKQSVNIFRRKF